MLAAERANVRVVADGIDAIKPVHTVQPEPFAHFPRERIAVDGVVIDGHSDCDEAIITGQSETQLKALVRLCTQAASTATDNMGSGNRCGHRYALDSDQPPRA